MFSLKVKLKDHGFPEWLAARYEYLDHLKEGEYVWEPEDLKNTKFYKLALSRIEELLSKLTITDETKETLLNHFRDVKFLSSRKHVTSFLNLPIRGKMVDRDGSFECGTFANANSLPMAKFVKALYDFTISKHPHLSNQLTLLFGSSRFLSDYPDIVANSPRAFRKDANLDLNPTSEVEFEMVYKFVKTIYSNFKPYWIPSMEYVKADGAVGFINFTENANGITFDQLAYNDEDKHKVIKQELYRTFIESLNVIKELIWQGDFEQLFKQFGIVFCSKLDNRFQFDTQMKERFVILIDSYYLKKDILAKVTYEKAEKLFSSLFKDTYDFLISLGLDFKGVRDRSMFPSEGSSQVVLLPYTTLLRDYLKHEFYETFKYGNNEYLTSIISNMMSKHKEKNFKTVLFSVDFVKFDHTPKVGYLAAIYCALASIEKIDNIYTWLLAIQAISPVMIGDAGFSKVNHRKIKNIILGDPFDYKTFNFAQGKSGDYDVDWRAKWLCVTMMCKAVLDVLELEYNDSNIYKFLKHELDIAVMDLGDNMLIIIPEHLREVLEKRLDEDSFLRAGIEENVIFGGAEFKLDPEGNLTIIRSIISFLDKLIHPETPYSKDSFYWPFGILARYEDAYQQLEQYGDKSLVEILEFIDEYFITQFESPTLRQLALEYLPVAEAKLKEAEHLRQFIQKYSDEKAREVLIDPEKLRWKYDPQELPDELKDFYYKNMFTKLDEDLIKYTQKLILGGIDG